MANQAIALQARAPQGNFLAPAIQQGAQMINMMRQQQALDRQTAVAQQQMQLQMAQEGRAAAGEARAAELHPFALTKAQADAMTADQKAAIGFYDLTNEGLKRASTPEQAMVVADYLKQKFPGAAPAVDQTISTLPSDPSQFDAWRKQTLFKSMTAQQQLAKKFIAQNTGTGTRQLEVSEFEPGAPAQELPGSEVDLGQEVTYVKRADGSVMAMPKRLPVGGGGGRLVGGVRGGGTAGGVQMGQPIAGTGKPAAAVKQEKPLTQSQAKSTGYAMRAQEADEDLAAVKQYSPSAIASKRYAEDIPVVGALAGPLVNRALSENDQLVEQAQRNFINAVLRQDSGAAINAGEWANAQRQYFAQPNDKPAVIAQKARNRATAIEALKVGAGAGMKQAPAAGTKTPAANASAATQPTKPRKTPTGVDTNNPLLKD